mmetsp:Transcript_32867/g.79906  ORF Transcript_32867/g.79906 Transcript_32867/m.79906 type:complete len:138 (-) Transcript_32867:1481-1894(-)
MTPQGRAIAEASCHFGDGRTLPFTPCKKGYLPFVSTTKTNGDRTVAVAAAVASDTNQQRVACPLHEKARRKRLAKENNRCRPGEADPSILFWDNKSQQSESKSTNSKRLESGAYDDTAVNNDDSGDSGSGKAKNHSE